MTHEERRAQCRAAQYRYEQTEKGKACHHRYAVKAKRHYRRVRVGARYVMTAPTAEEARAINAHIKRRQREFREVQHAEASARAAEI